MEMEYLKRDLGSYKLHLIKTKKFKTIKVKVSFRRPIVKEEITIRNILSKILINSSNKYKTKRDLVIKAQDLYAASISSSNCRIGNYINTDIILSVLNDKYTEKGNFKESLNFLYDIIYDPNINDNHFIDNQLDVIKTKTKTLLESEKEDSNKYSTIRMLEEMCPKDPTSYRGGGYLKDLEKINSTNLYEYYLEMLIKDLMDIFVIGDINFEEIEELIRSKFQIKTFRKGIKSYYLDDVKPRMRKRTVTEEEQVNQSKLVIGAKFTGLNMYERNYPLTLYNIILGGGEDSKLFRNVREKHSLCYYINSVPLKLDNVLLIRAGIDRKNIKKTVSLVEKEMTNLRKGKVSEKDIETAKEFYATAMDSIMENQISIMEYYYMMEILKLDDIKTRIKKMNKVSLNEIMNVAKKIKIDTIYCLEGVNDARE